jgi:hypothetical protein
MGANSMHPRQRTAPRGLGQRNGMRSLPLLNTKRHHEAANATPKNASEQEKCAGKSGEAGRAKLVPASGTEPGIGLRAPMNITAADRYEEQPNSPVEEQHQLALAVKGASSVSSPQDSSSPQLPVGTADNKSVQNEYMEAMGSAHATDHLAALNPGSPQYVGMTIIVIYSILSIILQMCTWVTLSLWPLALCFSSASGLTLKQGFAAVSGTVILGLLTSNAIVCCLRSFVTALGASKESIRETFQYMTEWMHGLFDFPLSHLEKGVAAVASSTGRGCTRSALMWHLRGTAITLLVGLLSRRMYPHLPNSGSFGFASIVSYASGLAMSAALIGGIASCMLVLSYVWYAFNGSSATVPNSNEPLLGIF